MRVRAETMPCETDCSRPKGLPTDMTQSPTCSAEESPISIGVTLAPWRSTLITAMSEEASVPTRVAS